MEPPAWPAASPTPVSSTEDIGVAAGFIHKVRVCSDVPPVQQNLLQLPFAVCGSVSGELRGFEAE